MDAQKKCLRSILTASPMALTVQQLGKEYRSTIGEPIPYIKFGYNSLEHFLLSIPDTVQLLGSGPFALVNPVISEKSSHVMNLVSRQKIDRKKAVNRFSQMKRMIVAPSPQSFTNRNTPAPTRTQKIFYPNATKDFSSPTPRTVSRSRNHSSDYQGFDNSFNSTGDDKAVSDKKPNYSSNFTKQKPVISKNNNLETKPVELVTSEIKAMNISPSVSFSVSPNVQKLIKSHMPSGNFKFTAQNGDHNLSNSGRMNNNIDQKLPNLSNNRATAPIEDSENCVPVTVRKNLGILIGKYPDGIWCAELPGIYRKMFRRELNYNDLGFRNLIDLCMCLKSIFHYIRPSTEDFKLYDRRKPLPESAEKTFTVSSFSSKNSSLSEKDNSALPNIDWSDMVSFLPPNVFKPGKEISRTFVPEDTKEDDTIDVMVGEVFDVSKFWVYRNDGTLDDLMDRMQTFYNECSDAYVLPKNLIREGVYCVTIIYGEYHRALIVDTVLQGDDMIRVLFIDYGTMTKVKPELYFLHEQFANVPAQTIRCRLANICPPEKGAPWSQECTKEFRQLIKRRDLTAKISRINWKDQFLEIFLADVTDSQNVFYINNVLVERGYALFVGQEQKTSLIDALSTPIVNLIHLFPTFLELEHGLAPSALEMEIYNDCNTPINFCYPQYFYVDNTDEEIIIKQVTEFYEKNVLRGLRKELHHRHHIDPSKCTQKLNMSHFGGLEGEMRAFLNEHKELRDDYEEDLDETSKTVQYEESDISLISEKIEMWKKQTVDELKRDRLLSEGIIKDLSNISELDSGSNDDCLERNLFHFPGELSENDSSFRSSERGTTDCNEECNESERSFTNHPLADLSLSRSNSLGSSCYTGSELLPHLINRTNQSDTASNGADNELDIGETNDIADGIESDMRISNPNNPFLKDLVPDSLQQDNVIVGNGGRFLPTNPFLSYVPEVKDDISDENSVSSKSTDYGTYIQEVKIEQHWSTDAGSMEICRSQYSDSLDSATASNTKSYTSGQNPESKEAPVVTETVEEEVQRAPAVLDVTKPEFYPQGYIYKNPYAYPSFYPNPYAMPPVPYMPPLSHMPPISHMPPVAFNNPYYNTMQHTFNKPVLIRSTVNFRQHAQVPSGAARAVCPPPGFESKPICHNSDEPAFPQSGDFYEAYNQMLRHRYGY